MTKIYSPEELNSFSRETLVAVILSMQDQDVYKRQVSVVPLRGKNIIEGKGGVCHVRKNQKKIATRTLSA